MRDILFRAKSVINGEWVEGYFCMATIGGKEVSLIIPHGAFVDWTISRNIYQVVPETVGQYTGLTDQNGTKIFEGDICRGAWGTPFEVFWDRGHTAFKARIRHELPYGQDIYYYANFDDNKISAEVIGNIYDNPKLLGGVK